MTKDYASYHATTPKSKPRKRRKTASNPSIAIATWIVFALVLGAGVGFGGAWYGQKNHIVPTSQPVTTPKATVVAEADVVPPPRFEFYTLLPDMAVDPNATEVKKPSQPVVAQKRPSLSTIAEQTSPKHQPMTKPTSAPAQVAVKPHTPADEASKPTGFMVQAGSFKSKAAAEKLKAKLAFKGLQSKIEPVGGSQGHIWYRVVLGPLNTQQAANHLQSQLLAEENLNSLILRVRV